MRDRRRAPFFWQSVDDIAALRSVFTDRDRATAIAIYVTLTEIANEHRSDDFEATRKEIAERSGVSVRTVDVYAGRMADAGLVDVERQKDGRLNKPNRWTLLTSEGGAAIAPPSRSDCTRGGAANSTPIQEDPLQEENPVAAGGSDQLFTVPAEEQTAVGQEPTEAEREDAIVATVFARWVALTDPPNKTLTPSRRRLIARAAKEAPVEILLRSLEGLVKWAEQKADGNTQLSRVFQTYPGGKPLSEQIEFFASQAGGASGSSAFPSVDRAKLRDVKQALIIARSMPENELAQRRAEAAVEWLGAHGLTHRFDGEALRIEQTIGTAS